MAFVDFHSSSFSPSGNAPALGTPTISNVVQAVQSQVTPAQFATLNHNEIEALRKCAGSVWCLYSVLALHANERGDCWPGRQRLATLTGMHPDHVSRALSKLENRGLITRRYTDDGLTIYHLPLHRRRTALPLPNLVAEAVKPLPKLVGITDHVLTDHRESATPEPATPEPAEQPLLSPVVLRTLKTPPPDAVPEDWLTLAAQLRPDLDASVIQISAERFLDDRRSKDIRLADWIPGWRNWIRNERGPKPVTPSNNAHSKPWVIQQPSPYQGWQPGKVAPLCAAMNPQAAIASFEKDMLSMGAVKQADGIWARPATPSPLLRPVVSMVGLETPAPVPAVVVEIEPPPPQATEKHRFSPLHGLIAGLRNPAPEVSKPATVSWRRPLAAIIDPAELAEAEALLAAEIARKLRGNPVGG